jgi:uncharacterized integral membrane protein
VPNRPARTRPADFARRVTRVAASFGHHALMVMSAGEGSASTGGSGARLGGGAIASIGGMALLVVFVVQNTDDVKLDFLFWSFTWPVWLLVIVSAVLGALVWLGLGVLRRHRRRHERREARRD